MAIPSNALKEMMDEIRSKGTGFSFSGGHAMSRNVESKRAVPITLTSTPAGAGIDLEELRAFSASREKMMADAYSALRSETEGYSMFSESSIPIADFFENGVYVNYGNPSHAETSDEKRQPAKTDIPLTKIESDWI